MNKAPLGCLLLHGLSSHINCIDPLVPRLEKLNIPYRMPYLHGHGSKPEDLEGVKWQDWYEDAEKAFKELLLVADRVAVIGLSMGGVVALDLALGHQEQMVGLVTIAAALKFKDPRAFLTPVLTRLQKKFVFKLTEADFMDGEARRTNQNYPWIPARVVGQLYTYQQRMRNPKLINQIKTPALVIGTRRDITIDPAVQPWLYHNLGATEKELKMFERSGHEMLRDGEREQVLDAIEAFVQKINDRASRELGQKQTQ
jgi:carboxylesterase